MEARIEGGRLVALEGAACPKGRRYAEEELSDPRRVLTTSVRVIGGSWPLASVRTTEPIPKGRILEAMDEIREVSLTAPLALGQVAVADLLGLGIDAIVTRNVPAASPAADRSAPHSGAGGICES